MRKIVKIDTTWSLKHKIFAEAKVDECMNGDDLRTKKLLVKYNISLFPTFVCVDGKGDMICKLSNPYDMEEFEEWKNRCIGSK